jgi:C4-dicarboxylate transporter, DctM subunit
VFTIIALAVGNFTPPVGLNLFIAAGLSKASIEDISSKTVPYILAYVAMLVLMILFPGIITFLV